MAPRPPVFDPARGVDRLPQPYRMIDKLVSEIVERALEECALKDKQKKQDRATLDRMVRISIVGACSHVAAVSLPHDSHAHSCMRRGLGPMQFSWLSAMPRASPPLE